ncbi:LysR family transcriptional regulator [Pleomorphomonas sp. NRK KF1]|uniref:LysR family transcriptional regulator n=1 Tax=Pleomorphomonas sp. NRK KF1 TaxID=2943000 RepID=UPI0020446C3C|nr:LysR family transcriptional regulator [Pleomorphomonas sp. NRK KF1]MCM5551829.1 LysR family transcriptional regulator [Pleomorphomonas sp. NRK KF1]
MIEKSDCSIPRSTLEQWAVLRSVVDTGSFAAAAAALNRSQSTISYALARLRGAIGVDLLRIDGRRAVLTSAGATLLAEVTPLIEDLRRLERRSAAAARGERLQIRLLFDTLFPRERLLNAIEGFAAEWPHVSIDLYETVRQNIETVNWADYDLAILVAAPGAKQAEIIARVELVAVAHPRHPLAIADRPISVATLAHYHRLEIYGFDRASGVHQGRSRVWRMNSIEAAVDAARRGHCFGWLPKHLIETDLANNRLVRLALEKPDIRTYPLAISAPELGDGRDRALAHFAQLLSSNGRL